MGSQEGGQLETWASKVEFCQKGTLWARKAWKSWVDSKDLRGWGMSTSLSTSWDTSCAAICATSCGRCQGQGRGRGGARKREAPRTRIPRPAAHQAVGGAPRGDALLPDAQRGPPPALFDAKAPVSAGAPAPLRWLAHLRGKDSGSAGHDRGSLNPPILCTLPGWMPSHPLPHPAQAPRTAARARSPWSCGFRGFAQWSAPGRLPGTCPPLCTQVGPRRGVYSGGGGRPAHALTGHLSLPRTLGKPGEPRPDCCALQERRSPTANLSSSSPPKRTTKK